MENDKKVQTIGTTASLEHLTGPTRGTSTWFSSDRLTVDVSPDHHLRISETETTGEHGEPFAILRRVGEDYEIEATGSEDLWINRAPVARRVLLHGDIVEFGERGPISRYRLHRENEIVQRSFSAVLADVTTYLRVSRRSLPARLFNATVQIIGGILKETTILFRIGVLVAIVALAGIAYQQYQVNQFMRLQITEGAGQLDMFAKMLTQTRKEALTPADLESLRRELSPSVRQHEERLAELERLPGASARIISTASPAVAFLQASYGFREKATGRMLRHVVDEKGQPLLTPFGQPFLSLDGNGPVAERLLIGTGFVVAGTGMLATNRHVAVPWQDDTRSKGMAGQGMEPVMIKFLAYFPNDDNPSPLTLVQADPTMDLALVTTPNRFEGIAGIVPASTAMRPGDEVIMVGYPTGLRSLIAQGGEALVRQLQEAEISGFWEIAAYLAQHDRIVPLASRGIVARVGVEAVVYDAETTLGGSGAPVLNARGEIIAVNTAIMPQFGGSNFGVPVDKLRELLKEAGIEVQG